VYEANAQPAFLIAKYVLLRLGVQLATAGSTIRVATTVVTRSHAMLFLTVKYVLRLHVLSV
jgi:hypothetical protein